jgi:hypothetical protein
MFVCCDGAPPRLFSCVRAHLWLSCDEVECGCEVVRHVSAEESAAWQMPVGFAVQFLDLSPTMKDVIAASTRGDSLPRLARPDPELERLLRGWSDAGECDHYQLLGLELDCDLTVARRRARECRARLEAARSAGLAGIDLLAVQPAIDRVNEALRVLGDPARRAEYDAAHHNFRGAAQCLAAGLRISDLEATRQRYLQAMPFARSGAASLAVASHAAALSGDPGKALALHERALALDPLDLELHHGYTRLKAQLQGAAR